MSTAAFFDVDETLIGLKSMFDFLAFHLEENGLPGAAERHTSGLRELAAAGAPREEVNRAYYRLYRGARAEELAARGRRWFARRSAERGFFLEATVFALYRHRAAGHRVVLLSGSFSPCLDPIADALEATAVYGTRTLTEDGVLTGEVERPMIGEAKGDAVREYTERHGIAAAGAYAYGDHLSDLPMLEAVGHPNVRADGDTRLTELALRRGWPLLRDPGPGGHGPDCVCGCALADWAAQAPTTTGAHR
ncbi:HAD family phosphatase [Nocardiopsis sp. CC223A]|uniref:HAD family hydrolase n=1 Tax=Nocardiopsis sp. CC223A TaxID=3044051 RepID=UPI00278BEE2C|nr:HAD-IB family hydrolase [Nocardiopsis sp. CC223A]